MLDGVKAAPFIVAAADAAVLLWGASIVVAPEGLAPGYEAFTGKPWPRPAATGDAAFLRHVFRLVGGLNVGIGLAGATLALLPFRRGERWTRPTLIALNGIGYGAPILYDQAIGYRELPEWLEIALFAAAMLALAASRE